MGEVVDGVGMKSGIHFLGDANKNIIHDFGKGSRILIRSRSKFRMPMLVHRYMIMKSDRVRMRDSQHSPLPSIARTTIPRPGGPRPRPRMRGMARAVRNRQLGVCLTCLPVRPTGIVRKGNCRACFVGSDGCCLFFGCVGHRGGD